MGAEPENAPRRRRRAGIEVWHPSNLPARTPISCANGRAPDPDHRRSRAPHARPAGRRHRRGAVRPRARHGGHHGGRTGRRPRGTAGGRSAAAVRLQLARRGRHAAPRHRHQPAAVDLSRRRRASRIEDDESEGCLSLPGRAVPAAAVAHARCCAPSNSTARRTRSSPTDGSPASSSTSSTTSTASSTPTASTTRTTAHRGEGRAHAASGACPGQSWLPGRDHLED